MLSTCSSIATLIMFVIYFFGRIWVAIKNTKLRTETFSVELVENEKNLDIYHENLYDLEEGDIFKITPTAPLLWLKVVPIIYDSYEAFIEKGEKSTGSPIIFHNRIINVGESIYIRSNTPDTFPKFSVIFQRFDYVEGSFNISSQGRYPGDIATDYTTSPTFLTFLFYLFK
jgi:hypothetical protein